MPTERTPDPSRAPADGATVRPTMVALTDSHDRAQLRFLAREVRKRDGQIVAIKSGAARVRLAASAKQIAVWGGYRDDPPTAMITSEGYRALNTVAQITVLTPPSLEIPGLGKAANPHVTFFEETGAFKAGWVRKVAIAPGPTGNIVLTDRTTYLSLVEYLLEDLIRVAQRHPTVVCWGTRDRSPADLLASAVEEHNADIEEAIKNGQAWRKKFLVPQATVERARKKVAAGLFGFYIVEPVTGQGLWFDRVADPVAKVFTSYAQTGKFGLRKLEAIAYRNVLRDHPLMPGMSISAKELRAIYEERPGKQGPEQVQIDTVVDVPVFFHEQVEDETAIKDLLRDFERGIRTAAFTEIDPVAARTPDRARVIDTEAETGDDEERPEPPKESVEDLSGPDTQEPREIDPRADVLARIRTAEEILGSKDAMSVLEKHPRVKAARSKASLDEVRAYLTALNNAINAKDA